MQIYDKNTSPDKKSNVTTVEKRISNLATVGVDVMKGPYDVTK